MAFPGEGASIGDKIAFFEQFYGQNRKRQRDDLLESLSKRIRMATAGVPTAPQPATLQEALAMLDGHNRTRRAAIRSRKTVPPTVYQRLIDYGPDAVNSYFRGEINYADADGILNHRRASRYYRRAYPARKRRLTRKPRVVVLRARPVYRRRSYGRRS